MLPVELGGQVVMAFAVEGVGATSWATSFKRLPTLVISHQKYHRPAVFRTLKSRHPPRPASGLSTVESGQG
jgi:hypothetical protein